MKIGIWKILFLLTSIVFPYIMKREDDFMNITQLKYFHAVCLYQTVSGAAEFLHISQPSVSNAIRDLEKEFNVLLF